MGLYDMSDFNFGSPKVYRRAYLPLESVAKPPLAHFANGALITDLSERERPDLERWNEVLSNEEIRALQKLERWIVYDFEDEGGNPSGKGDALLADTLIALQVAAPVGCFRFLTVTTTLGDPYQSMSITRRNQLVSTALGRMVGYSASDKGAVEKTVDTITRAVSDGVVRLMNPLRLLEHGLYNTSPYIRVFFWVTALDSLLMAVNSKTFALRLCNFLGGESKVFPEFPGVAVPQKTVREVAPDLFELRSEVAHGKKISEKYWTALPVIKTSESTEACPGMNTLAGILQEAALLILCASLQKIVMQGLMETFASERVWKELLSR